MNISEAARQSGLTAKQIRDYEKQGLLAPAARSDAGYRRYGAGDMARLHFIRHAREVGFSLKQIATLLQLQENPAQHIAALHAQTARLQKMIAELQRWHDACHGDHQPDCAILDGLQQE